MSGLYGSIGSSLLAPAATVLAGGPAARRLRGSPLLSLTLSGTLHLSLLAAYLVLRAAGPGAEPPLIEIRAFPLPPPRIVTTELVAWNNRSGSATSREGTVVPIGEPELGPVLPVTGEIPVSGPVLGGLSAPPPGAASDPSGGASGAIELDEAPGVPSAYEVPPRLLEAPKPEYPSIARESGLEGTVILEVLVSRSGTVQDVRIREGNPMLAEAAARAVRAWRFRPALWNGRPVRARVAIPVAFRLD